MGTCFVIQPFDNGKFDKRFKEVFDPAIRAANLTPYRVDKDTSVRIPIDTIEREIREAQICFADITLNNPNVWYELGYAFACEKDVVLVCSDERQEQYPFDIRHRHIIKYSTDSIKDFEQLGTAISAKLSALIKNKDSHSTLKVVSRSNETNFTDLKDYEVHILKIILEEQPTQFNYVQIQYIKSDFLRMGYPPLNFSLGIRGLCNKEFIECLNQEDQWGNNIQLCCIKEKGEKWVFENFEKSPILNPMVMQVADDLPF